MRRCAAALRWWMCICSGRLHVYYRAQCVCVLRQKCKPEEAHACRLSCVCVCGNVRRAQGGCPPKPEFTKGQKYIDEPAAE